MENSNVSKKLEKIIQLLKEKKHLTVLNPNAGSGAYGQVMIAKEENGEEVAIKIVSVFDEIDSIDEQKLKEIKSEAQFLQMCHHPNIVQYKGEFQLGSCYFIKMEKGEMSLQDFIDKKLNQGISEKLFVKLALQMLSAIQYLHSKNYVLRDISLKNVLLDKDYNIKLCDFGLAKEVNPQLATQAFLQSQVKGVLFYFPPEVLVMTNFNSEEKKQQKIYQNFDGDVWAFGICMYLLGGASFLHVLQLTQGKETFQLSKLVSIEINQILLNTLQLDPKLRPSIDKIIQDFKNIQVNLEKGKDDEIGCYFNQTELFQQAEKEIENHKYQEAQVTLERLVKINTHNDQYLALLGLTHLEQYQCEESRSVSQKCLLINPKNEIALCCMGYYYYEKNDLKQAMCYLQKCLNLNPKNYRALTYKAFVLSNQQKLDEELLTLKEAISYNQKYPYSILQIGKCYFKKKMYEEAITSFKQVIKLLPTIFSPYYCLGIIYYERSEFDQSISYFNKALEFNSSNQNCLYSLAKVYLETFDYQNAIQVLNSLVKLYATNDLYLATLALAYSEIQDEQKLLEYSQKSLQINPQNILALNCLAYYYHLNKQNQLAIQCLQSSIKVNPSNFRAYFYQALILQAEGKHEDAILSAKYSMQQNGKFPNAQFLLGQLYEQLGKVDKAIKYFQEAIMTQPKYEMPYTDISQIYRKKGQYDDALFVCKLALQNNIKSAKIYNELGNIYEKKQYLSQAINYFSECISLKPSEQIYQNNLKNCKELLSKSSSKIKI
ncbi:hypothetical protein ABPG73_018684 [Tetrahymena malaccensis]